MTPVVLIGSNQTASWHSSRMIERNLRKAYELALGRLPYLPYTHRSAPSLEADVKLSSSGRALAQRIRRLQPQRLVFIADTPHPAPLLEAIRSERSPGKLPIVTIHLYGNFTHRLKDWLDFSESLQAYRIQWVCASPKQARLVSRMIRTPRDTVRVMRFPVEEEEFHYSPQLRDECRSALGIRKKERVLLYAGGLSLQKNTTVLIEEFSKLVLSSTTPVRLLLAGAFYEVQCKMFGMEPPFGLYFQHWHDVYDRLPARARRKISYLGNVGAAELNGLYNASDLFVSLSLHHDEDYGMAPAEALCTGTRALLSNWGGYSSFGFDPFGAALVPVVLRRNYPVLRSDVLLRHLKRLTGLPSPKDRMEASLFHREQLTCRGVGAALAQLPACEPPRFAGFSSAAERYRDTFLSKRPDPEFYRMIYSDYRSAERY